MVVQWLGLGAFTAKGPVQSLVGELRSRKHRGAAKKKKKKKIVFPCLLTFIVYGEKSAIIYIVTPMCAASLFSLAAFKVLSLLLVFSSFDCVGPRSCFLIWGFFVLIFWGLLILDQ